MTINYVELHNHRKPIPSEFHATMNELVQRTLTHIDIYKVDIYNMTGTSPITGGDSQRLIVLANCNTEIPRGTAVEVAGQIIGYFRKDDRVPIHQFNITVDIFNEYNEESVKAIQAIFDALNNVYYQAVLDYSWKSTTKKEELTAEFTNVIKEQQGSYIREDKRRLEEAESHIRTYTRKLKEYFDNRTRYMNQIETAEAKLETVSAGLIKDLDNIIAHPKVKELFIKDGKFVVHTEPLYMYHDVSGDRYYLGNMRIEMNPQNTEVRFFGDNPRKSYWSSTDPHPHVNGRDGHACLGNVSTTIAELCSQMELYALTLIGIDFLESVNTGDTAGRNVVNWDIVDDDGNVIREGGERDTWTCDHCDETFDEDDESTGVYRSYHGDAEGNGDWGSEWFICNDCRDDHYTFHEEIDAYVRDGECTITEEDEE